MNRGSPRRLQRSNALATPLQDRVTGSWSAPGAAPPVADRTLMNPGRIMNLRPAFVFRAKVRALRRCPPPSGGCKCSTPGNPAAGIEFCLVVASREVGADRVGGVDRVLITPLLPLLFLLILILILIPHPSSPVPCHPGIALHSVARKFCLRAAIVSLECVAPALELT
jgi:hypothetical protein